MLTFAVRAESYDEIIEVLKHVETNNQPHLVGDAGASWGVLQIQKRCVDDVNRYFGTSYTHEQMFEPACAEEVAKLYMQMGAELYRKRHGKEPTVEVLVRNHNGGIYRGYKNEKTKSYYKKYLRYRAKLKSVSTQYQSNDKEDITLRPCSISPIWDISDHPDLLHQGDLQLRRHERRRS